MTGIDVGSGWIVHGWLVVTSRGRDAATRWSGNYLRDDDVVLPLWNFVGDICQNGAAVTTIWKFC